MKITYVKPIIDMYKGAKDYPPKSGYSEIYKFPDMD